MLQVVGEVNVKDASESLEPVFADFWLLYPRRVARKDAERAWLKLTVEQQVQAIVAIVQWRRIWADKDDEYLPHASTWLNGWRFDDEPPRSFTQSSLSHAPAVLREDAQRGTIPEHVRALIAKLRKPK
jgi:hypothetical protein